MRTPRTRYALLLALALPLAACGGDDGGEAGTTAAAVTTTAAASTGASGTASTGASGTASTGASGAVSTTAAGSPRTTAAPTTTAAVAKRADCLAVADLYNRILLSAGLGGGAIPAAKLDALKKTVSDVATAAPADLKADFTTVGEAYIASGTNGDTSKLTSNAYTASNDKLAAIITTCN